MVITEYRYIGVMYQFEWDLCHTDYIGYITRHLRQRIEECRTLVIGKQII